MVRFGEHPPPTRPGHHGHEDHGHLEHSERRLIAVIEELILAVNRLAYDLRHHKVLAVKSVGVTKGDNDNG